MNIAVDIRSLMGRRYTGVSLYTYNLLNEILKLDKENQYYLFYNSKKNIEENLPEFKAKNVHYCGFNKPNKVLNFYFRFLNQPKIDLMISEKFKTKIDIFFMPNWQFAALSPQCKKVLTVHDLSPEIFPKFYSIKRRLWHKMINTKKLCREFDRLIAVSKNTKKDLMEIYKIPQEKISVIYSGVNTLSDYSLPPAILKSKYNLPDKFLLYLGALEPRKNIIGIIKSFESLEGYDDLHLVLAGPAAWLSRGIKKSARKSPAKEQIHFLDYIEEQDKWSVCYLAEAFLYPSFYEGFGFPPLEAMSSGTPVISSANSSLGEILNDAAMLVDPYNIAEITKTVEKTLSEKNLKKNLIEKGFIKSKKFSWKRAAEEMLDVFQKTA